MEANSPKRNYSNEKFSFSLAIVVTLILCASASYDHLKTNSIFLGRFSDSIQPQKHKSNTKHEWLDAKTIEAVSEEGTNKLYFIVIPTVITTLLLIAFLFTSQIILRGIWFYVREAATEDRYPRAAARLDKWANFVYGLSFTLLILTLVFTINFILWGGLAILIWRYGIESEFEHVLMLIAFVWTLFYLGRHVIRTLRLNIRFWKKATRIGLVLPLVAFAGWALYVWNTTIITGLIIYFGLLAALFLCTLYFLMHCVDNLTGVLCLMRRHGASLEVRALLGRWVALAVLTLLVGVLFVLFDSMIVKTAFTLEMRLDKHVYRPGEIGVITLVRGGLIQGQPRITVKKGNNRDIKLEPVSFTSGDTAITYFLPINPEQNDSGDGPRVWRLEVSQFKGEYFGDRYLEVVDYLAILPAS